MEGPPLPPLWLVVWHRAERARQPSSAGVQVRHCWWLAGLVGVAGWAAGGLLRVAELGRLWRHPIQAQGALTCSCPAAATRPLGSRLQLPPSSTHCHPQSRAGSIHAPACGTESRRPSSAL